MLYRKIAKPILFQLDAEKAHRLVMLGLRVMQALPGGKQVLQQTYGAAPSAVWSQQLWGMTFPHPIGLAAGLDKNAEAVASLSRIGFGFLEVGTVTPQPQSGNDTPRLFRLPDDHALINRMGFNNVGMEQMALHLRGLSDRPIPIAVNIGKNKSTLNEVAHEDYQSCMRCLFQEADFFVVNISSPNTPGLRDLQHGDDLHHLLQAVQEEMSHQQHIHKQAMKPILVKISPDLEEDQLASTIKIIQHSGVAGIIATNTTLKRDRLQHTNRVQQGGLSGKPLTERSTQIVKRIYQLTEGKLPIIGCGGITTAQDVYDKIRAGASLVEIYTALIYEGPELLRHLYHGLEILLNRDGFHHISQAIGADHH
jgi:dihydroorotate dehydrogenase